MMKTAPDILANALTLPPRIDPPTECTGKHCAISGRRIDAGYKVTDTTTPATSEFLDTFGGCVHGYVSEACGRLFAMSAPSRRANIRLFPGGPMVSVASVTSRSHVAFEDGSYWMPLVDAEASHSRGRPCWSDVVRGIWPAYEGRVCVIILTDNFKKRLWPYAKSGAFGHSTPVFICNSGLFKAEYTTRINWEQMLGILGTIEDIYTAGFSKVSIRDGILMQKKIVDRVGISQAISWERSLSGIRLSPEFIFSLIIAQKKESEKDDRSEESGTAAGCLPFEALSLFPDIPP